MSTHNEKSKKNFLFLFSFLNSSQEVKIISFENIHGSYLNDLTFDVASKTALLKQIFMREKQWESINIWNTVLWKIKSNVRQPSWELFNKFLFCETLEYSPNKVVYASPIQDKIYLTSAWIQFKVFNFLNNYFLCSTQNTKALHFFSVRPKLKLTRTSGCEIFYLQISRLNTQK